MNVSRETYWSLSRRELSALAASWTAAGDERGEVVEAYLEARDAAGEPISFFTTARMSDWTIGPDLEDVSDATAEKLGRYRALLEERDGEHEVEAGLEVTTERGFARRINAIVREPAVVDALASYLATLGASFVDRVSLRLGPDAEPAWLDDVLPALQGIWVTPRVADPDDAWVESLGSLPKIRFRMAANEASYDFITLLSQQLGRGGALVGELDSLVTLRGLREGHEAREVEKNVKVLQRLAKRSTSFALDAYELPLDQARAVLRALPDAFGAGAGILAHHRSIGFTTVSTAARPTVGATRLVFDEEAGEVLLFSPAGAVISRSTDAPTFQHGDFDYTWIARDVSRELKRYLDDSSR
ncbi:MAG: hypothetical protein KF819_40110 [Labilithrix sp.]|nr:hypothetical protein [Labilithrix sp.]